MILGERFYVLGFVMKSFNSSLWVLPVVEAVHG